jgi:hypothetical protein
VPPSAALLYETLRRAVLSGHARPDGVGAIVYHGLVQGLTLLSQVSTTPESLMATSLPLPDMRTDSTFLHLIANMVLRTHAGVTHVY